MVATGRRISEKWPVCARKIALTVMAASAVHDWLVGLHFKGVSVGNPTPVYDVTQKTLLLLKLFTLYSQDQKSCRPLYGP